jgi:RNA polymerase sigma-70 factor (ECF subfamily)
VRLPGLREAREILEPASPSLRFRWREGARLGDQPGLSESDSDLLDRCRRGEDAAWHELVTRHARKVFALAYRFSGRVDEAEDLTQEIFVKVYQSLDRYREAEGAFGGWLMTVARHHAIDHYRRRRQERLSRSDDPRALESLTSSEESPLRTMERHERIQFVHRGLRSLPPELREPLILFDLQGIPYEEIATTLQIPLGTVKSRINRGRVELAKRLVRAREALAAR